MNKSARHLKSSSGQILILFSLILVIGMAVALSVASRTVTDIRTTTTSDESNRAYFAAEAGVEEALGRIRNNPGLGNTSFGKTFPTTNTDAQTDITSTQGTVLVFPENIARDEVAQVVLLNDVNDLDDGVINNGSFNREIDLYWGGPNGPANEAALEVSIISFNAGSYNIRKFAFDPVAGGRNGNNFCGGIVPGVTTLQDSTSEVEEQFFFRRTLDISGGVPGCAGSAGTGGEAPVFLRIRPLYFDTPIAIVSTSGVDLPTQGHVIESSGETPSGVTRRLKVIRYFPALPSLFDYVLFSGSTTGTGIQK